MTHSARPFSLVAEAMRGLPAPVWRLFSLSSLFFLLLVALRLLPAVVLAMLTSQLLAGAETWPLTAALYAGLFFARRVLEEARFASYVVFEQVVQKALSLKVLDLFYRIRFTDASARNASELAIIVDRGLGGIRAVMFNGLFSIAPLMLEAMVVTIILGVRLSWGIAGLVLVLLAVFLLVTYHLSGEVQRRQQTWFATATRNYGILTESLRSFEAVRAFRAQDWVQERYAEAADTFVAQVRRSIWPNLWLGLWQGLLLFALMGVTGLVILAQGGGAGAVEGLVLVNGLLLQISAPLLQFSAAYRAFMQGLSGAGQLLEVMSLPVSDAKVAHAANDAPVLRIESLPVKAGERVLLEINGAEIPARGLTALVGGSGTGKSLLAKTLAGLREHEGRILSPVPSEEIYLVNQSVEIFDMPLAQNVALAAEVDPEKLHRSLSRAGFTKEEIAGFGDRPLGEGGRSVSGGQRKRIGFARLLYHDARFIIVDEPTSELDRDTAATVIATLRDIARSVPVLAITHDETLRAVADQAFRIRGGTLVHEVQNPAPGERYGIRAVPKQ